MCIRDRLVDDNELNQVIAKEMLEMLGAEVEVAVNGQQAVEMIERNPEFYYELVFICLLYTSQGRRQ